MENKNETNKAQAETRKTILVVEDNQIVSSLIKVVLEDKYTIHITADGKQALDYLNQGNRPHLILLDVLMPVMNGGVFVRRVSSNPEFGKIPIIFITTIDSKRLMKDFDNMVVGYIVKPFEKEELINKVREVLK